MTRLQTLRTIIAWAKIRQENTRTIIDSMGLPSPENLLDLEAESEDAFSLRASLVTEACAKELAFLAEAGFPGISSVEAPDFDTDGPLQ